MSAVLTGNVVNVKVKVAGVVVPVDAVEAYRGVEV
jgi:hypothetical protein